MMQLIESGPFKGMKAGAYSMIMSDPAWKFATYSDKGKEQKSAELHYDTMTLDDIKALPVADLAAKDCFLWLWATRPMYRQAEDVMEAWGFQYVTQGHWAKTTKDGKGLAFGTGYVLRDCGEPYIIAKRGKPKVYSRSVRSVILAPRREHSRKPDEAYRDAEALSGPHALRADLFSRESRTGWDSWGNESTRFDPANDTGELMGAVA
jgi:N6-adenosine-specific RNA methylase IME4